MYPSNFSKTINELLSSKHHSAGFIHPYHHHQLPTHTHLKAKDKVQHIFVNQLSPLKSKGKPSIGRSFYFDRISQSKIAPGPGYYQTLNHNWNINKNFIKKSQSENKLKISIKKIKDNIGPGSYHYEDKDVNLSEHRRPYNTLITKQPSRFNYRNSKSPGPADYENLQSIYKTSGHRNLQTHQISTTKRSTLVNGQKIPGPGEYDWPEFYNKNKEKSSKPAIQYKFVYGHPS